MAQVINQYSAVISATALLLAVFLFVFKRKSRTLKLVLPGIILAGSLTAWFFLRPIQTTHMNETENVRALIGGGIPVLLEFQSPY